jgi:D-glycero-D-manno-heptose 1,7-bisphosphate phosphatase
MSKRTLFLDRDGVINRQIIGGYVTSVDEFEFLPRVLEAFILLSRQFDYIFLISNQQGIGKGVFSTDDLNEIHHFMLDAINKNGGKIDKIYFCPDLESDHSYNRKPNPGMGLQALSEFSDINLNSSMMVGDSLLDMQFGKNLGIRTIFLTNGKSLNSDVAAIADQVFVDLLDFAKNNLINKF